MCRWCVTPCATSQMWKLNGPDQCMIQESSESQGNAHYLSVEHSAALASAPNLASLIGSSQVSPSLLLAAREDQSFIDPVKAGTSTSVYKTLMGSVPDRGGRPGEIASYASMDREELERQQRGMRRRTIS
ncbi:uncharacterized protein LOC100697305 isoform X3 [Oreochromis niloticus]|uniref:uncharacterized protein LOC100697305 isoform X3 n=1 Tax=Oreochromis niloticus TaxID=8128 RepID=UPI000DF396ED|nr:uncharacterized protein LOC100697305 isoform X3 [Oreochromis niloticus]